MACFVCVNVKNVYKWRRIGISYQDGMDGRKTRNLNVKYYGSLVVFVLSQGSIL